MLPLYSLIHPLQILPFLLISPAFAAVTADDDDDGDLSFRDAFLLALPWGAGTAGVYLLLWCAATHNLSGPSGMIQPIG